MEQDHKWIGERIIESMEDPNIFGEWFNDPSWDRWKVFVKGLYGLDLTEQEFEDYKYFTGRDQLPEEPLMEANLICGRRAGKSRVIAAIATCVACMVDWSSYKAPGETLAVMVLSSDKKQAKIIYNYVAAFLQEVPMLRRMIATNRKGEYAMTLEETNLIHGVAITINAASFKSTRGYTVVSLLADEVCFWDSDEGSANPDKEIIEAIRPGMLTIPEGLILKASSPFNESGLMYEEYKRYFGVNDPEIMVWKAASWDMNSKLPMKQINRKYKSDPEIARREYGGEFLSGGENPFSDKVVDNVIVEGRYELPPDPSQEYFAFTDPSGGSSDSFTLAVGHLDEETKNIIIDAIRERIPPFDPEEVVEEFSEFVKRYGLSRVMGDKYAGEWPSTRFEKNGIHYETSTKIKSDLYAESVAVFNSGELELLDNEKLKKQFTALERRSAGSGKDRIDHPPKGHDDLANSVAGVIASFDSQAPIQMYVFD